MKKIRLLLLCFSVIFVAVNVHAQTTAKKWKLVWEENFNGNKLDTSTWNYEVNDDGGGNHELQYYTARDTNAYVKDGRPHALAQRNLRPYFHFTESKICFLAGG